MSTQDSKTRMATVATMLATATLLAACGTTDDGTNTSTDVSSIAVAVRTQDSPELGTVLADTSGKTLYFTDQEADGTIHCVAECLQFWFPAESKGAKAPVAPGVPALDVLRRSDNARNQLTYQ